MLTKVAPLTMVNLESRPAGVADENIIKVVARRHPGSWVAALVVLILLALLGYSLATDHAYDWPTYRRHIFDREFGRAAVVTLELTGIAMLIGIGLGTVLASMRMSGNVVLKAVAWVYLWVFRGTPLLVQLAFWAAITQLYGHIGIGVPFATRLASVDTTKVITVFVSACIGLGLNAAAYVAEVIRSGLATVESGQRDSATALGMSPSVTMRRVVLPQAAPRILTGLMAQAITTVQLTALVVVVPLTTDLFGRSLKTAALTHRTVPLLLAGATWYLAIVSVLMLMQFGLDRWLVNRRTTRPAAS